MLAAFPAGAELLLTDPTDSLYYRVAAAAGSELQIEKNTEVTGHLHSNGTVQIKKDVTVDGDVTAVGTVRNQGTVTGTVTEGADPVALPPIPAEDELRALADRIFEGNVTFTGEVIDDVVFVDGTVRIEGTLQGEGTILATGDVRLREDPTPPADGTRISVVTFGDFRIDKDRPFRGAVRAGGDVMLEMGVTFDGVAIADGKVHVKKDSRVTFLDPVVGPRDELPPTLGISEPREAVVRQQPVTIAVGYFDAGSGVDPSSLDLRLDGGALTAGCDVGPDGATCLVSDLAAGAHTLEVSIRDLAGNEATARRDFTVVTDQGMQSVGLGADGDSYLSSAEPDLSPGREPVLRVGGAAVDRTVVRLDRLEVARAVGSGLLRSARLELHVTDNPGGWGGGGEVRIHRLLEPWVEVDATWDCPLGLDPGAANGRCNPTWQGGDFDPAATDAVVHDDATAGWIGFDVTDDVLDLLAGGDEHGWLLRKVDEGADGAVTYASREDSAGLGPRLVLEIEAVAGPDLTPPELRLLSPPTGVIRRERNQQILVEYLDLASEVDLASLEVLFDGAPRTAECMVGTNVTYCPLPDLPLGPHTVEVAVSDTAGNRATVASSFEIIVDAGPPVLEVSSPAEGALVNTPTVEVAGTVTDDQGIASLTVEGQPVIPAGAAFSVQVTLHEGLNNVLVEAEDTAGRRVRVTRHVTLDSQPPEVRLTPFLPPTQVTGADSFTVAGQARDFNGIASVEVGGTAVPVAADGTFEGTVPLQEGDNVVVLEVRDPAGNATTASFEVTRFTTPEIAITAPAPLTLTDADTVTVSGTVSAGATVTVQGMAATVTDGTFTAAGVSLHEGANTLTAVATDAAGHAAATTVTVMRDRTPPNVIVTRPVDGDRLAGPTTTVTGLVSDVLGGLDPAAAVTVNGVAAEVIAGAFVATDVPLSPGDNVLVAEAFDAVGNRGEERITVRRSDAAGGRVEVLSGNHQTATVGTALPAPLVARVVDADGDPVASVPVLFALRGNDGGLDGGERRALVTTGADGTAQVSFTLGGRAGAGEQVVEAVAAGYAGPAVFYANALPASPARLHVDSGDQQIGCPGQPLPNPLVAVVTDDDFNRVAGVPVTFRAVLGDGVFENGLPEITVTTDAVGRASAILTTGEVEGVANNVVRAELASAPGSDFASFVASTQAALDPADTAISGLVLDNADLPIPGVTARIDGTALTAQTDETGFFRIHPAPVGGVHLVIDGSTAERPGPWPTLAFELVAVPGRDNTLGRPIPLVRLEEQGVTVDETRGGTVTLPEVPGFALEIEPGSVTFPDGSRSGEVSVSVVHSDKVPMVPNFGQQPRFVITIQPSNAVFDPPARLTLPNLDGLAPGRVTEMYSFDHDAGRFVAIGTGTVSDDGTLIVSDPGVGVVKAGWHCGGDPASSGTPHDCPVCKECDGDKCVPTGKAVSRAQEKQEEEDCDDGNECTNDFCENGDCVNEPLDETPCEDEGDPCTEDVCEDGTCIHVEMECEECMACDGGECAADPDQDGEQCMDEGDPSCSVDKCENGMCTHSPLRQVEEYDPDPLGVDIDGLDDGTQQALDCFEEAVADAGGNMTVNSAFRPDDYQNHLRQVWFRHEEYEEAGAQGYAEDECTETIQNIETEWDRHNIVAGPPARQSNHSDGNAFDATVRLPPGQDVDDLAADCDLNRPDPGGDPVHFVH